MQSLVAVAVRFEALPRVPILRAPCTVDAPLDLDLDEESEMIASFGRLLRKTWVFWTIFAPPLLQRSGLHILEHPIEPRVVARGTE